MLIVIDNYDSFTYNLVQAFGQLGAEVDVYRNDEQEVQAILDEKPDGIILSPGPGTPSDAGITLNLIQSVLNNAQKGQIIPVLGVCLGHQALGMSFGGQVIRAPEIVHGKTSRIFHNGQGLFQDVEQGFAAARYHSLMLDPEKNNSDFEVTAHTEDGLIMGLCHRKYPFYGVQFHPESIMTPHGSRILQTFYDMATTKN
ncbi:MAG TPA: anthranilate/aminodeoxychorismate synthase component II [Desulfosporosinus sp.]|nr:anthranilate/aminodeoxychorismate synthase component II [Desulfosporosinus sp.]